MYNFRFDFNNLLTGVCSHLHYIEDFNKILFTTNSNLRWDSNFIEDCFITNYLFKAWYSKRRRWGENKYVTNKETHAKNGNEDYVKAIFQNVPGYKVSHKDIELAIKTVLQEHHPSLLGIAEPSYDILNKMWFPGYKLLKGKLKGGKKFRLNVLIKDTITDYKVETFTSDVPSLLVNVGGYKFIYFYREWRWDGWEGSDKIELQEERWNNFTHRVKSIGGKVFVLGDANIDYLREDTPHQKKLGKIRELMYEMMAARGYIQVIKEDTRFQKCKDKDEIGLLDHVYTNSMKYVANVYNSNIHGYDHNAVGIKVRMDKPVFREQIITNRNYDKVDPKDFDQIWIQSNPSEIWETRNIEKMVAMFVHKVIHVLDILAPERKFKLTENYAPWVNGALKKEMRERDRLRKKGIKTKDQNVWIQFKEKRKEVRLKLREAESNYLKNYLSFEDEKTGWRRLKTVSKLKENNQEGIKLMINGKLEDDPAIVAHHMNNFFVDKVVTITEELPPDPVESCKYMMEYMKDKKPGLFEFKTVNFSFIKSVIMSLKNVTSTGQDRIPVKVYKKFRSSLTPVIARIVNECIKQSTYPQQWKEGVICPIPKKGDPTLVSNWRPIVLLPVVSRILEGVMTRQLRGYLEEHKLLHYSQHAYRIQRGVMTCIGDLEAVVSYARDQGRAVSMLQTDMTSAFNCVNAETLIPKMRMAGVGINSCNMMLSYLTKRRNKVGVGNCVSTPLELKVGSGEGTQISPLAWLIFIIDNSAVIARVQRELDLKRPRLDMSLTLQDRLQTPDPSLTISQRPKFYYTADKNYADDLNTVCVGDSNEELLETMKKVEIEYGKYFKALGLKESKAKQMHIMWSKDKEEGNDYKLNERPAEKKTRILGVTISSDFSYDEHVASVCRRMGERIPHIRAIRDSVDQKVLIRVSRSLILTIAEFCCEYTLRKPSNQKKVQKIFNILLRVITASDFTKSVELMLLEVKLLNISNLVRYYSVWSVQRLLTYKNSNFAYSLLNFGRDIGYSTRHHHLQLHWRPRTAAGQSSWLVNSVKEFNSFKLFRTGWHLDKKAKENLKEWILLKYQNSNLK